jgi:hypothetical protein
MSGTECDVVVSWGRTGEEAGVVFGMDRHDHCYRVFTVHIAGDVC